MLVAFPVDELNEENPIKSRISNHFGMANYIVFVDSETLESFVERVEKFEKGMCSPARLIIEKGTDALIVKGIGLKAISLLEERGIAVLRCPEGKNFVHIEECLKNLDHLNKFDMDDACKH